MRLLRLTLSLVLFVGFGVSASSQVKQESQINRILPAKLTTRPPKIDGDLSDAVWQTAPKAATFYDANRGIAAPEQTEAWLTYDEKYIYVAFHAYDTKPLELSAQSFCKGISNQSIISNRRHRPGSDALVLCGNSAWYR